MNQEIDKLNELVEKLEAFIIETRQTLEYMSQEIECQNDLLFKAGVLDLVRIRKELQDTHLLAISQEDAIIEYFKKRKRPSFAAAFKEFAEIRDRIRNKVKNS